MGVCFTAYVNTSFLRELDTEFEMTDCEVDVYNSPDFQIQQGDLVDGIYLYEKYRSFASMSCSYYNIWRNELAKIVGYPLTEYRDYKGNIAESYLAGAWNVGNGAFNELLNFSDSEFCICSSVCRKLSEDFYTNYDLVKEKSNPYFFEFYQKFMTGFKLASFNGFVKLS